MELLQTRESRLAIALAIGLLIGTERERRSDAKGFGFAGLRTFALTALLGGLLAYLGSVPLIITGALVVTAFALTAYAVNRDQTDRGITTEVSLVVTYVLGLLAKRLPKEQQKKALTYGLVGAFAFRILAISVAAFLLEWHVVKLLGGGYLAYIAIRHLFFESSDADARLTVSDEGEPVLVDRDTGEAITPAEEDVEIDQRVPYSENQQLYVALKKNGVPAKMIQYADQPHGIAGSWNAVHRMLNEIRWFNTYLKAPKP